MEIYVSTRNFGNAPIPDLLSKLDGTKYPLLEISSGHLLKGNAWQAIRQYIDRYSAKLLLHNYAPPEPSQLLINLSDQRSDVRETVVEYIKERMDFTKAIGSDYYSFHAGYTVPYRFGVKDYSDTERLSKDIALRVFTEELKKIVDHGERIGMHIGVENHVSDPENAPNLILYDADDFATLFTEIPSNYLHLHLDLGHQKVTASTLKINELSLITAFRDKIMGMHLHDNDGFSDQHQPFTKDAWFLPHLKSLTNLTYACLETKANPVQISDMENLISQNI